MVASIRECGADAEAHLLEHDQLAAGKAGEADLAGQPLDERSELGRADAVALRTVTATRGPAIPASVAPR